MLEEDKARIAEEEMLREIARQVLADERERQEKEQRSKDTRRKRVGAFLQTSLGTGLLIWFLGSVVVALITFLFAKWQAHETASNQRENAISQMNVEVASRLRVLNTKVNAEIQATHLKAYYPDSLVGEIIYLFITSSPEKAAVSKWPIINVYPRYNNQSILGLENDLEAITSGNQKTQAKSALDALTTESDIANSFQESSNPTTKNVREFLLKIHKSLESKSLRQEWQT